MQAKRFRDQVQLGFWRATVGLLSRARPLRPLIAKTAQALETRPQPNKVLVAGGAWVLGLLLGLFAATWWF